MHHLPNTRSATRRQLILAALVTCVACGQADSGTPAGNHASGDVSSSSAAATNEQASSSSGAGSGQGAQPDGQNSGSDASPSSTTHSATSALPSVTTTATEGPGPATNNSSNSAASSDAASTNGATSSSLPSADTNSDASDGVSGNQSSAPDELPTDPCAVKSVDAGNVHTCAVGYSGWVWCWGNNSYAAVGAGAANGAQRTPYRLEVLGTDNRDVLTGQDSSCVVKTDGRLLCWGSFGDGNDWDHIKPATEFDVFGTDWKQLSLHTAACAVTADNGVACWGFGGTEARVIAGFGNDVLQVSLSLDTVCAVKADGSVACGRVGGAEPTVVSGISDAVEVSAGGALDPSSSPWGRLLATTKDGSAWWAVGGAAAQELTLAGNNVIETYIGETTASEHMYAAGTSDGHIATWGTNRCGALGDGLGGGGDTSHDRRDLTAEPATVSNIDGYLKLAVGHEHACAIDGNHDLWCWGRNAEGQIGSGAADTVCGSGDASPNQPTPIHISLCPQLP